MVKKSKVIKCAKCGHEFTEEELFDEHADKAYLQGDKILCKDCLVMMGGNTKVAQTYLVNQNSQGTTKPHDW